MRSGGTRGGKSVRRERCHSNDENSGFKAFEMMDEAVRIRGHDDGKTLNVESEDAQFVTAGSRGCRLKLRLCEQNGRSLTKRP